MSVAADSLNSTDCSPMFQHRDDLEDAELETSQVSEGMPMHMSGFKDHPMSVLPQSQAVVADAWHHSYVLERHLKREEVIAPKREVGRFRGEPVYRRGNVLSCKTSENWMRMGRRVRDGQEALKWVKQRAVTLQKRRAQELAVQEGQDPIQQGLYAEWQTELYRPPPIVDVSVVSGLRRV
jgi:xeroderma pigmentosum group C-complementing protein